MKTVTIAKDVTLTYDETMHKVWDVTLVLNGEYIDIDGFGAEYFVEGEISCNERVMASSVKNAIKKATEEIYRYNDDYSIIFASAKLAENQYPVLDQF